MQFSALYLLLQCKTKPTPCERRLPSPLTWNISWLHPWNIKDKIILFPGTTAGALIWLILLPELILTCKHPANEALMYHKFRGHRLKGDTVLHTGVKSLIEKTNWELHVPFMGVWLPLLDTWVLLYCSLTGGGWWLIRPGLYVITPWRTRPLKKYRAIYIHCVWCKRPKQSSIICPKQFRWCSAKCQVIHTHWWLRLVVFWLCFFFQEIVQIYIWYNDYYVNSFFRKTVTELASS